MDSVPAFANEMGFWETAGKRLCSVISYTLSHELRSYFQEPIPSSNPLSPYASQLVVCDMQV
jgi:hypothetical protein